MENATKALGIAGGILLALLVVGLIVFGWNRITGYQTEQEKVAKLAQTADFNKEFESYNKSVIRGYQLVSLANLANDTNTRYSSIDGFTPISAYVMLCIDPDSTGYIAGTNTWNKNARLPGASALVAKTITGMSTKSKYFDLLSYINDYFNTTDSTKMSSDDKKQFKDLYFECTNVEYDGTSGRVVGFVYEQIFKNE